MYLYIKSSLIKHKQKRYLIQNHFINIHVIQDDSIKYTFNPICEQTVLLNLYFSLNRHYSLGGGQKSLKTAELLSHYNM